MEWFADSLFYMIGGIANPLLFSNSMLAGYKVLAAAVQEPSDASVLACFQKQGLQHSTVARQKVCW